MASGYFHSSCESSICMVTNGYKVVAVPTEPGSLAEQGLGDYKF